MTDKTRQDSGSTHIIRYALELGLLWIDGDGRDKVREALDALDTLEAQLEAIGAGGVSGPLMGRAALSANAGEPRALTEDQWLDLAERHANADWDSGRPDGFMNAVKALCLDYAAPPTAQAEGWVSVEERLPEPGMPVLLDIGKKYPIRAMWAAKHTVQAADDDTDRGEYVEADDMYYAPEGWYEWNQCEDNHWRVTETPRAWMPLPPTSAEGVEHG